MKRIGAMLSAILVIVMMTGVMSFGAENFKIDKTFPEDGTKNTIKDNMCVKVFFSKEVGNDASKKANRNAFKITDSSGKEFPSIIAYDKKNPKYALILVDTTKVKTVGKGKYVLQDDTEYTCTISKDFVDNNGNSLGKDEKITFKTINQSRNTMIYMVMMYDLIPGMLANCALLANLFFTLGILASFQSALTMPGIAGIVLTLGTAVDANVLIYERIKEEMRAGKGIKDALREGYSNAFSAIFDSNFTSLITGIILLVTGTGPIRGFATTWIIGIVCSFFTAVFLTRLIYENRLKKDKWLNQKFYTSISKNLMQNTHIKFMSLYKTTFTISAITAVLFLVSIFFVRGLSKSIDFTGGRNYVITLNKKVHVEDVRKILGNAFVNTIGENAGKQATTTVIALGTEGNTIRVSTNYNIESNDPAEDDHAETVLYNALKKGGFVSQANVDSFKNPDIREGGSIISSSKVGPSVAKDITHGAIRSVALALVFIFVYILLRFRNLGFSVGSVVALALDTLIVIGFYSVCYGWIGFSLEIDQTFIGAILTVIGYSINDKVVVFDRIRENMRLHPKMDYQTLFNDSINQTLARTINTSFSTLIVLLSIFILGGDSIRSFAFAMILGVFFGTLSSIFIASPVAYLVLGKKLENRLKNAPVEE